MSIHFPYFLTLPPPVHHFLLICVCVINLFSNFDPLPPKKYSQVKQISLSGTRTHQGITAVPRPTLSLCSQKTQHMSKQHNSGFVFCSKCPGLFQNSIATKNSTTRGQCYVVNVLRYSPTATLFVHFFPPVMLFVPFFPPVKLSLAKMAQNRCVIQNRHVFYDSKIG